MPPPTCVFCGKQQQPRSRAFLLATLEERMVAACCRAYFPPARQTKALYRCDRHSLTSELATKWRLTDTPFNEDHFARALESLGLVSQRSEVEAIWRDGQINRSDDVCHVCQQGGAADRWRCARCPRTYHTSCLLLVKVGAEGVLHQLDLDEDLLFFCRLFKLTCDRRRAHPTKAPERSSSAEAVAEPILQDAGQQGGQDPSKSLLLSPQQQNSPKMKPQQQSQQHPQHQQQLLPAADEAADPQFTSEIERAALSFCTPAAIASQGDAAEETKALKVFEHPLDPPCCSDRALLQSDDVWIEAPVRSLRAAGSIEAPPAKRQRLHLRPRAMRNPSPGAWRRACLTSAMMTRPASPMAPPSAADLLAGRALLISARSRAAFASQRPVQPVQPAQPCSWRSGQSFTVRVDRARSQSVVIKCFFAELCYQHELAALTWIMDRFSLIEQRAYVREFKSVFHLYPKERDTVISAARSKISDRSEELLVPQRCLAFAFYAATLGDAIFDQQQREQFQRSYKVRTSAAPGSWSPIEAGRLLGKMALHCFRGLQQHHRAGVLLGDIKPDNLFISSGNPLRPVFGDYGLAYTFAAGVPMEVELAATDVLGTRRYRAPEAERCSSVHCYTAASDVFSLASTLIDVMCHKQLDTAAARHAHFSERQHHAAPQWLVRLLLSMLIKDVAARCILDDAIALSEQLILDPTY